MIVTKERQDERRKALTSPINVNSERGLLELDYLDTIAALQSERDALREALLPFKPSDKNAFAYMELAHPDKPRKYPITVTDRDLLRVHSLLSTPASDLPAANNSNLDLHRQAFERRKRIIDELGSGEPARKP